MKFCSECGNMYYIKLSSNNKMNVLVYYCRNCGKEENDSLSGDDVCVYTTQIKKGKQQFHHNINQFTKFDPTLPRVDTIPCPNDACPNKNKNNEVIYIRYDDANQLYIYLCSTCDTVWRTER